METYMKYLKYTRIPLGSKELYKISDGMYISKFKELSVNEYILCREQYCKKLHDVEGGVPACSQCRGLVNTAKEIQGNGMVKVSDTFKKHFSGIKYSSEKAVRKFMSLPVVIFELGEACKGTQTLYMIEQRSGIDYIKYVDLIKSGNSTVETRYPHVIDKDKLRALCELASTEKDRKLIKYAMCADISGKNAKKYGISDWNCQKDVIDCSIERSIEIREAVNELASIEEKVVLRSYGIEIESDNESLISTESGDTCDWVSEQDQDSEEESGEDQNETEIAHGAPRTKDNVYNPDPDRIQKDSTPLVCDMPSFDHLVYILQQNHLNWFSFVEELKVTIHTLSAEAMSQILIDFANYLPISDLSEDEEKQVEKSRQSFLLYHREKKGENRDVNMLEGTVCSDSESDNPDEWIDVPDLGTEDGKKLVQKQRRRIRQRAKRQAAKRVAEECLLKRKLPKRVGRVLRDFPEIGKEIENFVHSRRVGADAWRRTGILTFDGNLKQGQKVTYKRIKKHLEEKYKTTFSYGTIVQLSVVRNKRRLSAKRYKGVARITCRRARKGFSLRFNPDAHWSCSLYKGLDKIQLKDGTNKCVLNRDDASGFRLDTTFTHKQNKVLSVSTSPEVTTRTDFVNKYSSILQVSSYLIMESENTADVCGALVKGQALFNKNAAQHISDLTMLENTVPMFTDAFSKDIECIRVDGASDEGPGHEEIQFYWSERHLAKNKACTIVTTRHSGGSYLNKVELLNGCISVAHSNVFIPSTLNGPCYAADGLIDEQKVKLNQDTASDVYIDRVSGATFNGREIFFTKGASDANAVNNQTRRKHLLVYLKGSRKEKEALKKDEPTLYKYLDEVWMVRNNHMIKELPSQYIFLLLPCYKEGCCHELCRKGEPEEERRWYENGPPLTYIPFPIPDQRRPWGGDCSECPSVCTGHFLSPEQNIEHVAKHGSGECHFAPPSEVIKREYSKRTRQGTRIDEDVIRQLAKSTLLSKDDVHIWMNHLSTLTEHRRAGAKKAAKSRANKKGTIYQQYNVIFVCSSKVHMQLASQVGKRFLYSYICKNVDVF